MNGGKPVSAGIPCDLATLGMTGRYAGVLTPCVSLRLTRPPFASQKGEVVLGFY